MLLKILKIISKLTFSFLKSTSGIFGIIKTIPETSIPTAIGHWIPINLPIDIPRIDASNKNSGNSGEMGSHMCLNQKFKRALSSPFKSKFRAPIFNHWCRHKRTARHRKKPYYNCKKGQRYFWREDFSKLLMISSRKPEIFQISAR